MDCYDLHHNLDSPNINHSCIHGEGAGGHKKVRFAYDKQRRSEVEWSGIILLKHMTGRADMDHEFAHRINEEIERYRNALLHYAKQCEWESFKSKAGALFDYLEKIEL